MVYNLNWQGNLPKTYLKTFWLRQQSLTLEDESLLTDTVKRTPTQASEIEWHLSSVEVGRSRTSRSDNSEPFLSGQQACAIALGSDTYGRG